MKSKLFNQNVSFAKDIKPLFRAKDQNAMINHFDLWKYEDVKANADDIYTEVSSGNMPCDGAWPPANVALFKSWMDAGMPA
jgi:hypothetical protein